MRDFYVDGQSGNDSYNGMSSTFSSGLNGPWKTIARADTPELTGGDCINVAPGSYAKFNSLLSYGGSFASSTGYVAYRCSKPAFIGGSGCVVTDTGDAVAAGYYRSGKYPSFLIFDGFNLVTTTQTVSDDVAFGCAGPGTFGIFQNVSLGCHHWWIINNVITGHGQAGVNINDTEYTYVSHNTVTQNAHQGCNGFYGSGIALVVSKPVIGYAKTPDDTNAGENSALTQIGIEGPSFPFNNVIAWNVVANNYQGCPNVGAGETDGNGIIIDTQIETTCNANLVYYPNSNLVAFNVVYNNGGGGVHIFASANTTVANNSVYYNSIDPTQDPWDRPGIDVNCGSGVTGAYSATNVFINNIAFSIPGSHVCPGPKNTYPGSQIPFTVGGGGTYIDALYNIPGHNISFSIGTPCHETDDSGNSTANPPDALWSCTTNKCNTNPLWVDVGIESMGSESVPPQGSNFALSPTSPAINSGSEESYLPPQSVDVGACYHSLKNCP